MNLHAASAESRSRHMGMPTVSIAPINAISRTGLGVISLTEKEQNVNEIRYQVSMSFARRLLDEGTITEECYNDFDTKMQQKYQPTWGKLFTDLKLELT